MAETTFIPAEPDRLPRCCPVHEDWATLARHLVDEFPEVRATAVIRELARSRNAVEGLGLSGEDALQTGELIVRHQLMLLTGRSADIARLDPERHEPRG